MLVGLVAVVMIFGIPLAAILGHFYVRARRLEIEAGGGVGPEAAQRIARLEAENADFRKRIEVLETIVTTDASPSRVRVSASAASSEAADPALANTQHPGAQQRR